MKGIGKEVKEQEEETERGTKRGKDSRGKEDEKKVC